MREKLTSIIVFLLLLTPASWARPLRKPAPAAAHRSVANASLHSRGRDARRAVHARPEPVKVRRAAEVPARSVKTQPAPEPVPSVASAPPPEPAIHVHHDRKAHQTPGADESSTRDTVTAVPGRRVATVDDFMAPLPSPPAASTTPYTEEAHPVTVSVTSTMEGAASPRVMLKRSKTLLIKTPEEKLAAAPPLPQIPFVQPVLFTRRGRLIVPPAMKGSHEILVRQNAIADQDGLDRVQDDEDLDQMREEKLLVALPAGPGLAVDERLPGNRRYCRPWTAAFLSSLSRAHYARFHSALQVNSAVRTVAFQERLRYTNGNAAPAEGATASPHLTGQAVDLAKHGLSMTEIAWLRAFLLPLVQEGKVDVEEEFQQACFHISVYKRYMPQAAPRRTIPSRRSVATALAATIR